MSIFSSDWSKWFGKFYCTSQLNLSLLKAKKKKKTIPSKSLSKLQLKSHYLQEQQDRKFGKLKFRIKYQLFYALFFNNFPNYLRICSFYFL